LHIAGFNGELEIAKLLLRNGADVHKLSKANKSVLHLACQNGHLELTEHLLSYGSNVNEQDIFEMTPLHW
jgi:ankyrin repeat protein